MWLQQITNPTGVFGPAGPAAASVLHRGTPRWSEGPDVASSWKLLLFELISEPLWRVSQPRGLRTKVGACSNKSNFVPNEEVRIGLFRFSSLKGPFKCILVCVIWSGESRTLGVGGHDDLASFSCSSPVLVPCLCATIHLRGIQSGLPSLCVCSHFL